MVAIYIYWPLPTMYQAIGMLIKLRRHLLTCYYCRYYSFRQQFFPRGVLGLSGSGMEMASQVSMLRAMKSCLNISPTSLPW